MTAPEEEAMEPFEGVTLDHLRVFAAVADA